MNGTPISVRKTLWRWRRDLARAVLLLGALAGLTLGTAHAQVAFRSASSATHPVPTFRAANSAAAVVPAPAPTFVAAGAVAANTTAITPALPAGIAVDDILLLFLETSNQAITIANQSGGVWTAVANSPQSTGTAANANATRLTVFWSRYNGVQTAPVTSDSGNHQLGRMIAVRGVDATGNPWDVTAGGVEAGNNDTSGSIPGATTTVDNTLVVAAIGTALPDVTGTAAFSAFAAAGLTGEIERTDNSTNVGDGGALGIATGVRAAAGAYGATTVTTSVNTAKAMMSIALRPQLTLTITKPAGTIQNDVMVASFGFRTNQPGLSTDIGITPPAGWTLVRRLDNPGPTDNGLAVYQKVAGAAEPANYTWELSCTATCATNGFNAAAGGIASFSNVNTTTPVDVENGVNTAIGAQTAPSITTTAANAMLVASYGYASAGTWTPPAASGGDAAMTEAVDILSGLMAYEMSYVLHAVAGATAAKQATPAPDDDEGNAHILALRPALQSTITINKPAGTVQNDVMIASIGFSPNTLAIPTVPAGWALVRRVDNANANANSLVVYQKVAGAAEPANYAWTFSAAGYLAGGISTFSGVDTTTPVDVENGNCTQQGSCATTTLSHATPSVATTVANTMLVTSHTYSSAGTWAPPGAMTEAVEVQHGNQSLGVNYVLQAATGATGAKTATASTQADVGNAHILALRPAAPVVPTPGSFNAFETSTAAGAITGVIRTRIAGSAFGLDVVAIAGGVQQAGFTDAVIVELLGNNTLGVALNAQNCPTSFTLVQTVAPNPTITAGRSTVNFAAVADSWRDVRVRVRWPAASPTVTWCSTDNFAVRPDTLTSFAVTDTDWQTTGTPGLRPLDLLTFAATTPTHKAGRPFSVRATAVNAAAATTTNYVGAPTATLSTCGGAACTATFGALTLTTTFVAGQLASDVASYDNVGSFALRLEDPDFASVDTADTTGDCTATGRYVCSGTLNVGRFVPDHFAVALSTPSFGSASWSCGFTYVGQVFNYTTAPVITITARNFTGADATFYTDNTKWWRITNGSLTGKAYAWAAGGSLDTAGAPGTDPVINDAGAGTGTLTFSSGTGFFFTRTTPSAPFNAEIRLRINVLDLDNVTTPASPVQFGDITPNNGIAFDNSAKNIRFGRVAIRNANGSQLVPLPVQLEAQHWLGAPTNAFVANVADNCTSIAAGNVTMANYTGNLSGSPTCETAISGGGVFSAGRRTFQLAAPGSGNGGTVDLTVNLAAAGGNTCTTQGGAPAVATPANLPHLQGNWTGGAYNQNPGARASFGVFGGAEEVIFIRENFQ